MNQNKPDEYAGTSSAFTAVVLAGDRGPNDPLIRAAGVSCKALTPVGGRPMVLRVLDALDSSTEIDARVLCGPPSEAIESVSALGDQINSGKIRWLESRPTPSTSAQAAMELVHKKTPVLITTADHALLTPEIVDYFCAQARESDYDLLVGLARCEEVMTAFPEVKRTVMKFRDGGYCGCNLFAFMTPQARKATEFWQRVESQRKNPLRVIGTVGWIPLIRYVLGRLSLSDALKIMSKRLGVRVGAIIMPFPEAAVDVDKVSDWEFANRMIDRARAS